MAMNRLTRDDILKRALDLVDSSALDLKDRPAGTILSTALSIGWLQEALDYFQKKFPFQNTIKATPLTLTALTPTLAVPTDYILDVRDGILLANDEGRLKRRPLSYILSKSTSPGTPAVYTIRGDLIHIWPTPSKTYSVNFYHYALSSALAAGTVPTFPDDMILVRYVWLAGREWLHADKPGTAMMYADSLIKQLQTSGIMQEPEEDQIPLDSEFFRESSPLNVFDWMGKTTG